MTMAIFDYDQIGKRIKKRRTELGYSQLDLYKLTGITNFYISKIENGHVDLTFKTLEKLCVALDVDFVYILTGKTLDVGLIGSLAEIQEYYLKSERNRKIIEKHLELIKMLIEEDEA